MLRHAILRRPSKSPALAAQRCLGARSQDTRDRNRFKSGHDPNTGHQVNMIEVPDTGNFHNFNSNTLEHVKVPVIPLEQRKHSDVEREAVMVQKYGAEGPGKRLEKTMQQTARDALQKQQDIDGLPWEVRWRRNLIPTHEEIISEMRDRLELYELDPIEQEKTWYLHWRDRLYNAQRDRLIWPQGYTDYLDHYDETGRRRTLPTDQRWSDVSWKHLADTNYRDRMWMIESEEKRQLDHRMDDEKLLLEETKAQQDEVAEIFMGIQYGVIDIDPDQAAQALTGNADPMEVAKTKFKVNEYAAEQAWTLGKNAKEFDPVTGLPKSDRPPLPTGVTIEQAASIDVRAQMMEEKMQQDGETAMMESNEGASAYLNSQLEMSRKTGQDRPGIRTMAEHSVKQMREANLEIAEIKRRREAEQLAATTSAAAAGTLPDGVEGTAAPMAATETQPTGEIAHAAFERLAAEAKPTVAAGTTEEAKKNVAASLAEAHKIAVAAPETPAAPPKPQRRIVKSGFIDVPKRPEGKEPAVHPDIAHKQQDHIITDEVPEWYRQTAIDTDPMIPSYGMTNDPIEARPILSQYTHDRPSVTEETTIVTDQARMGENAFDEAKMFKERQTPELAQGLYKDLPTYQDFVESEQKQLAEGDKEDTRPKSEKLREERRNKSRGGRQAFDPDLALPDLPWETDPSRDPNRGVSQVALVNFDRKTVEKVFKVYKEFMQQRLVELSNMTGSSSDERVEQFVREAIDKVRKGHVGDHPVVAPEITDIFKMVYEGHFKAFLSEFYNFRGGRKPDAEALKTESDDMLRKAGAKAKLLGQPFVDLMQEMTAVELDTVRHNPIHRYCILCRERSHEVIAKPFIRWIQEDLNNYGHAEFTQIEEIENHRNAAMRTLNEAKFKSPRRIEGVKDHTRDYVCESFYHWCRGALVYHSGRHYWNFYLRFADSRFRYRAQEFFEESWEVFIAYHRTSREVGVHIPVPYSEHLYEIGDKDFLEGENGCAAESNGDFEKAERIWHTGTVLRWYPLYDETDFLLFMERRGKFNQCYEISDRCLESLQKKTHPSVSPFPARAKVWLEGAPMTQETTEHLWLRHMGDVYLEHADFCGRAGKQQTAREHMNHALNFYRVALREAKERLPPSWKAPVLTRVKLLARCATDATDPEAYLKEVEEVLDIIYKMEKRGPNHWIDRMYDMHWRATLVLYALPMWGRLVHAKTIRLAEQALPEDYMVEELTRRSQVGFTGFSPLELAASEVAEEHYRKKVLAWRDKNHPETDEWHLMNLAYFTFKVTPRTPAEVDAYKEQFWKTYDWIYMQTALGIRSRTRLFPDAVRRLSTILLPGTVEHKQFLLKELQKIEEKLHHALQTAELKRAVSSLELHLKDPSKPPYLFGTMTFAKMSASQSTRLTNPVLLNDTSADAYSKLREREARNRSASDVPAKETNMEQGGAKMDSEAKSGREMLKAQAAE
jgi:hypothetical protein